MNNNYLYRSSIFLIILACTEDERAPIFGNPLPNPPGLTNELNLQSDSGYKIDSVNVTWNNLGSAILKDYSTIPPIEIQASGNSHVFSGMQPGEFREIHISITADSTYEDSIQIYTRTVHPVTKFTYTIQPRWVEDGNWNEGEYYEDGNNRYDEGEAYVDSDNGNWDPWEEYVGRRFTAASMRPIPRRGMAPRAVMLHMLSSPTSESGMKKQSGED